MLYEIKNENRRKGGKWQNSMPTYANLINKLLSNLLTQMMDFSIY